MEKDPVSLYVLHDNNLVGELTFDSTKNDFAFVYDQLWVKNRGFFLSPHIVPGKMSTTGAVTRFLENLLPEGEGLRHLAQVLKVSKSNVYALISAIGGETTGALTLTNKADRAGTDFRPIGFKELAKRIQERKKKPITEWDGKPRLSLAGVQEKLPLVLKEGQFGFGEGKIASTHILKFGNEKNISIVINEFFCMKLASAVGLDVAECELLEFSERVLLVKRFDRYWKNSAHVQRLHIIDGCQALDISPIHKYERLFGDQAHFTEYTGPANLENIYNFCSQTQVPVKNQLKLLQWVFFNILIGNSDHHVKNISFFIDQNGMDLTPFYDLVSVAMYPEFDQSLAFHIGDTFELDKINAYHFAEMASELNLKKIFVANQLKKICQLVLKKLQKVDIGKLVKDEKVFIRKLSAQIKKRSERFLDESSQITKFRSI